MLEEGVIEPATGPIFLNRLFEVPKRDSDKTRLVLDVSRLNTSIPTFKFRMTTVNTVRQTLSQGCFLASIDLKDAYWHIPIAKRFRPFLAFSAGKSIFQFRVLPFGLNIAPRVFSKMMRPVHSRLASLGVNILMYLDDWLVMAPSERQCKEMVRITLEVGETMGLHFNLKKSQLVPSRSIQWLGMRWDSHSATVALSEENQLRCRKKLFRALHSHTLTRRQWESLMGSLNHAGSIIPLGRLRCRRLLREGRRTFLSSSRDTPVIFPKRIKTLLQWWTSPHRFGFAAAWTSPPPLLSLSTDASDSGWGYQSSLGHQGEGAWSDLQARWHINSKELVTVLLALQNEPEIRQGVIQVLTDNTTVVHCINKQGTTRSAALLRHSEQLLELCHQRALTLQASYLAGAHNTWADALSRGSTSSIEWSLTQACFEDICSWAGTPSIDLFASQTNHRLPLYISLTERTIAGGPDALKERWDRWDYIYLFPPPNTQIMLKVAHKLTRYRGRALLIAPWWETQPWFPLLLRLRPRTLPLQDNALRQETSSLFMTSLRLHAWNFSA